MSATLLSGTVIKSRVVMSTPDGSEGLSTVYTDNVTIEGDGSLASPVKIKTGYLGSAALEDVAAFDPAGAAAARQEALVSGTNIKTINGTSILGSGNLIVGGTVADASETVAGKVEEATAAQVAAGTHSGETGAPLFIPPDKLLTYLASAIPSANNSIYFSPAQNFNTGFIVFAAAIIRASNAYSAGVTIAYEILTHSSAHNSSFFTSAEGVAANGRLRINYPAVRYVVGAITVPDETYAGVGCFIGPTVDLTNLEMYIGQQTNLGLKLRGDGSTTWVKSGNNTSSFTIDTYGSGGTSFNVITGYRVDYTTIQIQYIGTNNYGIRRVYSGLGSFNIRFVLVDRATGLDLSTNPTSSDEIIITNAGTIMSQVTHYSYNVNNQFMANGSGANIWSWALFECWMVAAKASASSIQVRWQTDYPSATNYKIYRDTSSTFATQVLIYTGTAGVFVDTGLSATTLYHYKMVAVIAAVDTTITTFRAST